MTLFLDMIFCCLLGFPVTSALLAGQSFHPSARLKNALHLAVKNISNQKWFVSIQFNFKPSQWFVLC